MSSREQHKYSWKKNTLLAVVASGAAIIGAHNIEGAIDKNAESNKLPSSSGYDATDAISSIDQAISLLTFSVQDGDIYFPRPNEAQKKLRSTVDEYDDPTVDRILTEQINALPDVDTYRVDEQGILVSKDVFIKERSALGAAAQQVESNYNSDVGKRKRELYDDATNNFTFGALSGIAALGTVFISLENEYDRRNRNKFGKK